MRSIPKRLFLGVTAFSVASAAFALINAQAHSKTFSPSIDQARAATVRIRSIGCGRVDTGTGFAIAPNLVITNRHVVEGASRIELDTWDGQSLIGSAIATVANPDLAIVRVDKALPTLPVKVENLRGDQHLTVLGYPGGGPIQVSSASLFGSATNSMTSIGSTFRITAPIQGGSSGSPVLNDSGDVVGLVYAAEPKTNRGFALSAASFGLVSATPLHALAACSSSSSLR